MLYQSLWQRVIGSLSMGLLLSFTATAQIDPQQIKVIVNNEGLINSEELEFSPAFYEDGLVFVSTKYPSEEYRIKDRRIQKNIMSIYWAKRNAEGTLDIPSLFSESLLTVVHEGPVSFDRTQETVYFTRNNIKAGRKVKAADGIVKLQIYSATKNGNNWENITELPFNNDESSACHPSLSVDGDVMYFASDREGGFGGMDLYMVKKQGDTWGEPKNLGASVNTDKNEVFPFIHADGTLYFTSNNDKSIGEYDIFFTRINTNGECTPLVNLGKPFNSEADDLGFILDANKKNGFFASNRKGGKGQDDIYSFQVLGEWGGKSGGTPMEVTINAKDAATGKPLEDVTVQLVNLDEMPLANIDGNYISLLSEKGYNDQVLLKLRVDTTQANGMTDTTGKLTTRANSGNYVILAKKAGYRTQQVPNTFDLSNNTADVALESGEDAVLLTGAVTSGLNQGAIPNSKILMYNERTGKTDTVFVDKNGEFEYYMQPGDTYTATPVVGGKLYPSQRVNADGKNPNIDMAFSIPDYASPVGLGVVFELPNIFYNFNDAELRPEGRRDLDAVALLLREYPAMEIELSSHTDSRGPRTYNDVLSERRATLAKQYLVEKGVAADRIAAIGYGEQAIRNGCTDGNSCNEEQHQYNRRTEVKIIRISNTGSKNTNPSPVVNTTTTQPPIENTSTETFAAIEGKFYVISGTYKNVENANAQMERLRSLGYNDVRLVQFKNNNYNAVCVGQYDDQQTAQSLAETLNDQKIDTYVRFEK